MKITMMSLLNKINTLLLVCLFLFPLSVVAQKDIEIKFYRDNGIQPLINGAQDGDFAPGTYLIPHDIMIEKGKIMTIFPGSTILFTQNAMLVVNGTLICAGTTEAPVVFKKLDNQQYFEPLDPRVETRWDGIYLPDSANLTMSKTIVSDSKYGIVISGKDVSMTFDSVRFVNNKFQNVKIGERMMKILPNTPIVFRYPEQEGVFIPPAVVQNATETIQQKRNQSHKTAYPKVRMSMGALGGVGLLAGVAGYVLYNKSDEKDQSNAKIGTAAAATGAFLFGVGVIGFTWTFFY
jgi:hypothetical protein